MCNSCGNPNHVAGKMMYKCNACDKTSDMPGECCGAPMSMVCDCGSGKMAKECCQPE